jgi:hypothetical protein
MSMLHSLEDVGHRNPCFDMTIVTKSARLSELIYDIQGDIPTYAY